jgi:hypothetical protein
MKNTRRKINALFWEACERYDVAEIHELLSCGADVNTQNGSALRFAIYVRNQELVDILRAHGAKLRPNMFYDACRMYNFDIVIYLLSHGVNIHEDDDMAIRSAAEKGNLEMVKYFVLLGANISAQNDYALRWACALGHLNIVKYLISQGVLFRNYDDYALQSALSNERLEIAAFLISKGAAIPHMPYLRDGFRRHLDVYIKHYNRRESKAATKIYFLWIQRCYRLTNPSGIRMAYRNLEEFESLCTEGTSES